MYFLLFTNSETFSYFNPIVLQKKISPLLLIKKKKVFNGNLLHEYIEIFLSNLYFGARKDIIDKINKHEKTIFFNECSNKEPAQDLKNSVTFISFHSL